MITLFTTDCPKCKGLEAKLNEKHVEYVVERDVQKMIDLGLMSAPALQVDDKLMRFSEAVKYVNELEVQ